MVLPGVQEEVEERPDDEWDCQALIFQLALLGSETWCGKMIWDGK